MGREDTTVGVTKAIHERLKKLAKLKGCSVKAYIGHMTNYFYISQRDPQDFAPQNDSKLLQQVKKETEGIKKILKSQEVKIWNPIGTSIFGIEKELIQTQVNVECPKCRQTWYFKEFKGQYAQCSCCAWQLRIQMGQYRLERKDIISLLSGGMTRRYEGIQTPQGDVISGRFSLNENLDMHIRSG